MRHPPLVIFTDLDGTLLDHDSYSHAPADATLAALRAAGIPVVLASSKTAAEIAGLRRDLGLEEVPAICENGAGLVPPGPAAEVAADDYARIRAALDGLPPALRRPFTGFGDLDTAGVARLTGLAPAQAALARQRQFSEPGTWAGSVAEKRAFLDALGAAGIAAREGGRFLTLSLGAVKSARMAEVLARYGTPPCIALGDAPNDIEMLRAADRGVIVANPHRAPLPEQPGEAEGRILRTEKPGPGGWSLAVERLVSEYGIAL